jgi:hypothetical protein
MNEMIGPSIFLLFILTFFFVAVTLGMCMTLYTTGGSSIRHPQNDETPVEEFLQEKDPLEYGFSWVGKTFNAWRRPNFIVASATPVMLPRKVSYLERSILVESHVIKNFFKKFTVQNNARSLSENGLSCGRRRLEKRSGTKGENQLLSGKRNFVRTLFSSSTIKGLGTTPQKPYSL